MPNTEISKLVSIFKNITTKLVESQDPYRLYNAVVQIAMETTNAQACSLYLEQSVMETAKQPNHIIMVAGAGFERYRIGVAKYKKGEGLTGSIWKNSIPVKYNTREEIENPENGWEGVYNEEVHEKVRDWGSYSLIGMPLRIGERTIGVLKVENKNPNPPSHFSEEDLVVLEIIASTIALAIENQRYSEQTYSDVLSALRDVSEMLIRPETRTFKTTCQSIVEKCIDVFNAEACSLYIEDKKESKTDPEHIIMEAGAGYEKYRIGVAKYKKGEGLTGSIWKNSIPVKYDTREEIENPENGWEGVYNDEVHEKVKEWECCSLIGIPLRIGDKAIGVLKVENKKPVKQSHFTYNELRTLEILASNIALALEMQRNSEILFKRGFDARKFTHSIVNDIKTAHSGIKDAIAKLKTCKLPIDSSDILQILNVVKKTLLKMDDTRKSILCETNTDQYKETISLNDLINRVISYCQPILNRRKINLTYDLLDHDAFIYVNPDQVVEAFNLLIGNAIDALDNVEEPKIWIKVEYSKDSMQKINFATILLIDNGPGFSDTQRKEFKSQNSIRTTKTEGSGLGLKNASEWFHDNRIYLKIIDPPPDLTLTGAVFQIEIPLFEPRTLKVLIIDDDENQLELFKIKGKNTSTLKLETRTNYEILQEAIDGSDVAIKELFDFDLIFLDCFFTDAPLTGPQLLKRIHEINEDLSKKFILMSVKEEYINRTDIIILDKSKEIYERFPQGLYDLLRRRI